MLHNQNKLLPFSYNEHAIQKYSVLLKRQFSSVTPTFAKVMVTVNEVEDETDYFQMGQNYEQEYMVINMEENQGSSWN